MDNFISYGKQWISNEDIKAVVDVLRSDYLTQGPSVEIFEQAVCSYTGAKYCIAVSNGTAALHLAVAALGLNIDDEGITSPITFVASANCLIYCGQKPVFADIDPKTYNISPLEITKKITPRTKVVIPVDFAGQPADLKEINKIAKRKNLFIIEDASHALGSRYQNGAQVGSCKYSDMTIFSFHPVKTITTGEGGAITTNNKEFYDRLCLLRSHGIAKKPNKLQRNPGPWYYEMQTLGFNYRLTDIQAALGVSQLARLDKFVERRREIVQKYNQAFKDIFNIATPFEQKKVHSGFHLYVLQIDFAKIKKSRKEVMEKLKSLGIGTQIHYIPVHLQPYYQKQYGYKPGDFPVAENYYEQCLSLPLYPKMTNKDTSYIINNVRQIVERQSEKKKIYGQ